MRKTNFIIKRNRIINQYLGNSIIQADESLYGQYTIVSANLCNYLPEIDPHMHMQLFVQLLIHKKLSKLEQAAEEALSFLTTEGAAEESISILKKHPALITTFHTGSYRLINLFLLKNNVPFTLVISKSIIEREGKDYISSYRKLYSPGEDNFRIIDAENAHSGLQMLRELKQSRSLLLYLDGNSGAGSATISNDNHCVIDFLEQQLHARKGIGYLSHAANVPIIPVINYRSSWNEIKLLFATPVFPSPAIHRNEYAIAVTQKLYDLVSPIIREYPEQWEAWLYLHKVAKVVRPVPPPARRLTGNQVRINLRHYGLLSIGRKKFLFNKHLYLSHPISYSLFELLNRSVQEPLQISDLAAPVLKELYNKGAIEYL